MTRAEELYFSAFKAGITPDRVLNLAEWSNENIVLAARNAAEPGPYNINRTPFWIEVAEALSPSSPVQKVVVLKSAQIGFSQLMFNWIGFCAATTPAPILLVQPTTELAERVSKQRIASMIDETKVLRDLVSPDKAKTTGNTILLKEFGSGAILLITGANSPVGLRSMPIRFCALDETSSYPPDVGGEGSAIALAEKRTATFKRKKILIGSTPTIKDADVTEMEFLKTDQRRYFVPCPHCGGMQDLKWRNVIWTDNDPDTARYRCEHCGELIHEYQKREMLELGQWQATAESSDVKVRGYHISALYSPWMTWAEVVREFLDSKSDGPRLKTWVNTILGETFEAEFSAKVGAHELMQRAEDYEPGVAPAGVLICTAGVDVQDNRIAIKIKGWGKDEESWLISYQEILGDPAKPELWKQVQDVLSAPIKHETHGDLKIAAACIDSGGTFTHQTYLFCREHRSKNWLAIKGQSQRGKPAIGKASKVDVNFRGQTLKGGAEVFPVGSDTIKSVVYGRLKHNEPGPGFLHFHSGVDVTYFEMLTAEKQVIRYVKGFPIKEWTKKSGARNEALDCEVYAYAALQFILNQYNRKTVWDQLSKKLKPKNELESNSESTGQNKPKQANFKQPRRSFVNSW